MFRTELPLIPAPQQLPLSARVLTIGSCFSDTIGTRLTDAKVHALVNPFGTVFNPISACKLLRAAAGEDTDWQQHLVEARGRWQSYDLHATVGAASPVDMLQSLHQLLRDTGVFLATADTVILTLGSAWAYRLKETDELVSNCHKMPAEKFDKELLTPDEIINAVAETHAYLRLRNPKLRFVLTVSPVRHLKDTLPLNAVSKSVLRIACHYLSELLPDVSYFPAYELLLDDLRDYRFYAADMLHPSAVAEDYIWERFSRTYFDADFGRFRKEWDAVRQALNHRPLYEAAPEHRQFLVATLERLEKLSGRADMRMEILEVRKRLESLPLPTLVPAPEVEQEDDEERIDVGEEVSIPLESAIPTMSPVLTELGDSDELAEDELTSEAESMADAMTEAAQPKKKRRSRGGAKRNKKKHAARLAEEAATAVDNPDAVVATDPAVAISEPRESVETETADAPPVTVAFDPEAPLQTALERRKRASRRNRGRNKQSTDVAAEATPSQVEPDAIALEADALTDTVATDIPESPISNVPNALNAPEDATNASATTEPTGVVTASSGTQRPQRVGRSASEVRAAALRKPRRPDSRMKALYATPSVAEETEATPVETGTSDNTAANVSLPTPAETVVTPATPAESLTASDASITPPRTPVVSAIPPVRGTGASGRLSASGQATLTTSKARSATASSAPQVEIPNLVEETPPPADSSSVALESPTTSAASIATDEPALAALPIATAPKKPRPKSASSKPEQPTDAKPTTAKAKPKAKKAVAQPKGTLATTDTSPLEVAAEPSAPVTATVRKRKAPAKPAKTTAAPTVEKPKRAPRPPRQKPAAPDEATEAS
jgi:hypothetical protein